MFGWFWIDSRGQRLTISTNVVLSRISNSRLQECRASSSLGSYGINTELWFEYQCRLVQKLDLVDENIWKCANLNPLPVARLSYLLSPSLPAIFLVWISSIWSLAEVRPLIAPLRWSIQSLRNSHRSDIWMTSLSFDWGISRLEKQRGFMSLVCTSLAPSRRPSRTIHLSCSGLTVCPDLLQPVFMSQFVSQLNGCLLKCTFDNRTWIWITDGNSCFNTLVLANPARFAWLLSTDGIFFFLAFGRKL